MYLVLLIGLNVNSQAPNITYPSFTNIQPNVAVTIVPNNTGGTPTYRTLVSTYAGWQGGIFNSTYPNGFTFPIAVTTSDGSVYALDDYWPCIRKIHTDGTTSVLAGKHITDMHPLEGGTVITGYVDGQGADAEFNGPKGLAVDNSGNVYVADTFNHRIRKITPSGLVTTIAGDGSIGTNNGTALNSNFSYPYSLCLDNLGNIYILDLKSNPATAINCAVVIRKIDTNGIVSTIAGNAFLPGNLDGQGTAARFNYAKGITIDTSGNLYVSDTKNNRIKKVTQGGLVTTFSTGIYSPIGITIDSEGFLYVSDSTLSMIKKIDPTGVVTDYAGTGISQTGSDLTINGLGNVASFNNPNGIIIDSNKNVFVADRNTQRIRKVSLLQPYTIDPDLPAGLTFNSETGIISGAPTATSPSTTYTITASNYSGTSITTITFSILATSCLSATTWNGLSWSNGPPTPTKSAIIDGNYDTSGDGPIDCCNLIINNGFSLIIQNSDYCNVYSNITVSPSGTLLVKSGGSLIANDINAISIGIVNVERRTTLTKRYDYTYWSSPVGTTLGNALPVTNWEPDYTFGFNTSNYNDIETSYWGTFISNDPDGQDDNGDAWEHTSPTDIMVPGKGYASMIKSIPATGVYPRTETVTFTGPLNVGQITIPLQLSQNTSSNIDDFNLIGNPYSAAINSNDFIDINLSNISGTLYFWTHTNTLSSTYSGLAQLNYSTNDYAKRTKLGGISAVFGGKQPANVIGSGQGFLVEAETENNIIFLPSLLSKAYVNSTSVSFFKERDREDKKNNLWLDMKSNDFFSQQLIGYNSDSELGYDKGWDSLLGDSKIILKFYSLENNMKYDIQARGEFNKNDLIHLGYTSAIDGLLTISVNKKEGKLKNQTIYLYDSVYGEWFNLSTPYTFTTQAGEFNDRFYIKYKIPTKVREIDDNTVIKAYNLMGDHVGIYKGNSYLIETPAKQFLILKVYKNNQLVDIIKYYKSK